MADSSIDTTFLDCNEDYTGAFCLFHKLTKNAPQYEEILVDIEDFDYISQYSWRIGIVNSKARCKYVVRSDGAYLAILLMKPPKGMVVDHISRRPLDNRRSNLRVCTQRENTINRRGSSSTSKFKGVLRHRSKWHVVAGPRGKRVFVGRAYALQST